MNILGINAYHPNASAAVISNGVLLAAAEEERFNRIKYAAGFPEQAIRYCLTAAGLSIQDVDFIAIARDPWARMGRKLWHAARMPRFTLDRFRVLKRFSSVQEELERRFGLRQGTLRAKFHRMEHHVGHMASAFFVSPFDRAAVMSADGLGDFASTMWGFGQGSSLKALGSVAFPHSLGVLYTGISQYLGFQRFGDEYKVMGMAAYGRPVFLEEFRRIVRYDGGCRFRLALDYFIHHRDGVHMTWEEAGATPALERIFSPFLERRLGEARKPGGELTQRHYDVAASLQARLEEVYLAAVKELHRITGERRLCLAGGVAFNCLANGKILENTGFEEIFVQPAAGDAGLSIGAAFHAFHERLHGPRGFIMEHAYWGPGYSDEDIRKELSRDDRRFEECTEEALIEKMAKAIAEGAIVGWYQGRAEWGPRALGNRSILADPRREAMKDILNKRIKHREHFRPFAPSVLEEAAGSIFEQDHPSPFMNMAFKARAEFRDRIPATLHVDGTGRLQTVRRSANPRYWRLIKAFEGLTGVPVLLNTSFNDNEPIVCSPKEAIDCFESTRMDLLAIGKFIVRKRPASSTDTSEKCDALVS